MMIASRIVAARNPDERSELWKLGFAYSRMWSRGWKGWMSDMSLTRRATQRLTDTVSADDYLPGLRIISHSHYLDESSEITVTCKLNLQVSCDAMGYQRARTVCDFYHSRRS